MKNEEKDSKRYQDVVRPTFQLSRDQHTKIKIECVKRHINIQDFITHAVLHCLDKGIFPK